MEINAGMPPRANRSPLRTGHPSTHTSPSPTSYADPKLIEYMLTHKRTFLFSFDNDLKIRCKLLIRDKQPTNRVFSEEDF